MTRRILLQLALAVTVLLTPFAGAATEARAPRITVSPPQGSQYDTFTFEGSGFDHGMILAVGFHGPAGEGYLSYKSGQPITVTADADGEFAFSIVPSEAFAGSSPGTWRATFCTASNSPDCWSGAFDISLD